LFLLTYSLAPEGWEGLLTAMASEDDLVQALAYGFCMHCERVVDQGLLRGYVAVAERRNDLRGRVRFADQLGRLAGLPLPVEVAYDDFTADIEENRLLRGATERLLCLERVPPLARARLLRLRALLEHVSVPHYRQRVDLPAMTRLNQRYEAALVLGKLILDGTSLHQRRGPIMSRSFLFDMNEVFESFLFTALSEALRAFGGVVRRQVTGALDSAQSPGLTLRADIVWYRHGAVRAVIDSKYKALTAEGSPPNEDAYQMLAYCIGFGVRRGLLVYAREGADHPRRYEVKRHGYEIDVRSLGLGLQPEKLLAEVSQLAADIASTAPERLPLGG
jgi:5-methylcytosine-specific restriction enzyme subunit McrC